MNMIQNWAQFPAIVKDGQIVVPGGLHLPDGTEVVLAVKPLEFTPEERAEFEAWDRLSDEAFQMILDLEREDRDARG